MYVVCKVEDGGTLGKLEKVAFGGEHKHFVFIEVHLELVHELHVVAGFKGGPYVGEPFVKTAFSLYSFVTPVCSQAFFCNFVHSFCAYLHLYPFVLRAEYGDVKALVAVRLWHGKPVAQPFGVGLVHVRND